ncbi:MAG TPA: ATP-binding protein [Kofleriaceae bacterium]|nr:ATP-binding protein [Kofleriaceae bacterium]
MSTAPARITRVRFAGLRTAASVELDLEGLTVLIGPNGVGKSTLIEGFELLRRVMVSEDFLGALHDGHGGPTSLVTHGARELTLGLDATTEEGPLSYEIVLEQVEGDFGIARESLHARAMGFVRTRDAVITDNNLGSTLRLTRPREPFLHAWSQMQPLPGRVGALLEGIEVHSPFRTNAAWLSRAAAAERSARSDNVLQATSRLARGGTNLPNAFQALRHRDDWQDTLDTVRLLVDEDLEDVLTPESPSGGSIGLAVKYRTGTVPASALSDGTLSLLSLVALIKLDEGQHPRSLLVLDEPDLHLHPSVMRYVVTLLEECAERCPVVVATHSDHFLDCLSEPARSVVLCDLDEHRHLRLKRPDAALLAKWLPEYRGVGELRADGYGDVVFAQQVPASDNS